MGLRRGETIGKSKSSEREGESILTLGAQLAASFSMSSAGFSNELDFVYIYVILQAEE